jgi:4'-phosphopantetheinyl transferase
MATLLLSQEEQRQQLRFHFERDRHRYLVTRAMQRTVLSKYVGIAPRDWRFTSNDYGRPSIAAEHAAARGLEFNLSHTDGLVVWESHASDRLAWTWRTLVRVR